VALAFVSQSRVSMQRGGMLAVACLAAASEASSLERVAARFDDIVGRNVAVPSDRIDQVDAYLRSLRLWKRYGHLRAGDRIEPGVLIALQDMWLSDPRLPSATGAITREVLDDIPQLAVALRMLRHGNLTRTDRARALLAAYDRGALAAVIAGEIEAPNPLILPPAAQLLIAYALLESDGDFLRAAWGTTPVAAAEEFTRADFATGLRHACESLAASARRSMPTGADRQAIRRLLEWAEEIAKGRNAGKHWGGGRPPDQLATLRLEPFVDLGLITRLERTAYRYALNDGQRRFFRRLAHSGDAIEFARSELVAGWVAARGGAAERIGDDEIWERVRESYEALRSPLGFAPFVEVVLLAIGRLINEDPERFFEIQHGMDVIHERRRTSPKQVRLTIDRSGRLTYMKLTESKGAA
jgi:hypothetical protein